MDHRLLSSRCVGWLADRHLPRPLRAPAWRLFARAVGADLAEVERPLATYPSLTDFFVRHLAPGTRPPDSDPQTLTSPVDGRVQSVEQLQDAAQALQAKGQSYAVAELLGGLAPPDLAGWWSWICYLSPRDYHRIHSPFRAELRAVRWIDGERLSVAPRVLARTPRVFTRNARVVLALETDRGLAFMVLVGALNVSRIVLEGLTPGPGPERVTRSYERGDEVGRFEMGSTVILVTPPHAWAPVAGLDEGTPLRMGARLGVRYPPPGDQTAARSEARQ